ncbi:MAG: hypothetical protein H2212_09325 [Ruminococcus sp.]|uniref:DUF6618 family protein n=1 Tax=Clostridium sp. C105KSO13 TaxID=1776045 RepID=UPI00074083AC|nr:DUF6618 family protein [Clostridium sp. C105KSO13]MBA4699618.1 hypothetical protein [Ruminococcus sp.]CUX40150.1 hypothetical protein BN3456_02043 [Clostridium sp. C105KSO13]
MSLFYKCHGTKHMNPAIWKGEITFLDCSKFIEINISARGSTFHAIIGAHSYNNFICVPNWGIGTELAGLSDRFWNLERLTTVYPDISQVDTISIVDALVELSKHDYK